MPPYRREGCRNRGVSFDHLVGLGEDRWRDGEAERLRSLEIDDQLERGRLHDWQVGRLGALEDLPGINSDLATDSRDARPIADQAAGRGVFTELIDRRNGMACRQRHDLLAPDHQEWIGRDEERAGSLLDESGEGGV